MVMSGLVLGAAPILGSAALAQAPAGTALDEVKKRGVLRAGVRQDVPGFGIVDEKGNIVGFDIDVATEIATRLGVKIELVPVTAATRIPLLQQGRIDMIAATLTHYRERDKVVDFTIGYFWTGQKLMVKKASGIHSVADMAGKRAGTTVGALALKNLTNAQPKAIGQTFEGYPEAFLAMQRGLVDAVVADIIILAGLRANSPAPGDYMIVGDSLGGGDYAIGVRENDSKWRDALNFALQDMWKDGAWDKIYAKWIGPGTKLNLDKSEIGFKMEVWE
ncbi:MAG: ABC transporter substrate-binding protein [Proteobacteria bacterium]|nr:ABC transporter substrate-binding protein [Pseudomonadota bacterium]MBS0550488.1 ABC transporter substrate-binding protein [Pseudomonadota bacterium]